MATLKSELNIRIRATKKVIKWVFTHNMVNNVHARYLSVDSAYIVQGHHTCNGNIEMDLDSRKMPNLMLASPEISDSVSKLPFQLLSERCGPAGLFPRVSGSLRSLISFQFVSLLYKNSSSIPS